MEIHLKRLNAGFGEEDREEKKTVRIVGSQTFYRTIVMLDLNLLDFRQSNLANETTLFVARRAQARLSCLFSALYPVSTLSTLLVVS